MRNKISWQLPESIHTAAELIISLAVVFGFALHIQDSGWKFDNAGSFFWLPLFVLILWSLRHLRRNAQPRLRAMASIPAILLSIFDLTGSVLVSKNTVLWLVKSKEIFYYGLLKSFSTGVLLFSLICFCWTALSKFAKCSVWRTDTSVKFNKKNFMIFWLILLVCWVPWLLANNPGVMTADTTDQLEMALGVEKLTDHHPVFYTWMLKAVLNTSRCTDMSGDNCQLGISVFTIIQFLYVSAAFAAVLNLIWCTFSIKLIRICTLVYFAFYPVHPLYSVTIWKDIPFSVCVLLLVTLLFLEMKEHRCGFCLGMAIIGILMTLFRHNGIYLIMLSIPFLPAAFKGRWKPVFTVLLSVCFFYFVIWRMLLSALEIPRGQKSEAFSIPLQQIALVLKRHPDMSPNLMENLESYFTETNIGKYYTYRISDPVKNRFNEKAYKENTKDFWSIWLKTGTLYPQDYIDAFLLHTFGYWYPATPHWVFVTGIDDEGIFGIHMDPIINEQWMSSLTNWLENSKYDGFPLLPLLFSPGACFWLCLIFFFFCLFQRSSAFFLYIPLFILWLTAIASPVNCEFRYVYPIFACLPLILSAAL